MPLTQGRCNIDSGPDELVQRGPQPRRRGGIEGVEQDERKGQSEDVHAGPAKVGQALDLDDALMLIEKYCSQGRAVLSSG